MLIREMMLGCHARKAETREIATREMGMVGEKGEMVEMADIGDTADTAEAERLGETAKERPVVPKGTETASETILETISEISSETLLVRPPGEDTISAFASRWED